MNVKELRDFVPFLAIDGNCVMSKRGDLTFGWKLSLPIAFSVSEEGYDSIIKTFFQAYKLLPLYCVVHKQDVYRYDEFKAGKDEYFLRECYLNHFSGRRFLNGFSYLYLTFSSKAAVERKNSESGFFGILDKKVPSAERIRTCYECASQFESILKSNSLIGVDALSSADFLGSDETGRDRGVIADYMRFYELDGPDYNLRFRNDRVEYGDKQLKVWYVEDSDAYPPNVSSVRQVNEMSSGASQVFLSGGSPIGYGLRIPHVVNRYILTLPKGTVEKELDGRKRVNTSFSGISAECAVNSRELEAYLDESADNSAVTVKCFTNLMAWAGKDEVQAMRNAVVTAFRSEMDVQVVEEDQVVPLYFYAGIPSAAVELGYDNYLNSEVMSFLCHGLWDGYDFGMDKGVVHVCDRRRMIPVTLDIQSIARARGMINNMNCLVVGPSGSGKSFTMNSLVQDYYTAGEHVMIIDIGDSYQGLCAVVNEESGGKDGVYNTYDPDHPFAFNPFKGRSHWDEVDDEGDRMSSGMDFLLSLIKTIYKPKDGWSNEASSALKFMVNQFFSWWDNGVPETLLPDLQEAWSNKRRQRAKVNGVEFDESKALYGFKNPVPMIFREDRAGKDPIFDDFYRYVTSIVGPLMRDRNYMMGEVTLSSDIIDPDRFGAAMDMYKKDGIYGFLLNAEQEADLFNSRLTVFEVDKIKENQDLFPLWVLCIMHSFEEKMRALPCQKVLVIEEAWKAIATDTMKDFIVWMWRTARKHSTSAVVVTQSINDLVSSEVVKDAIILNTDVRILLDQRANALNFDFAATTLGMSDMAKNLVLSVNTDLLPGYRYKEGFFAIGNDYCNVFAIEVSPEQALCFETDKILKAPLYELAKERGSMIAAIREMAEAGRKKLRK